LGAAKRPRVRVEVITDFRSVVGDPEIVVKVLGYKLPSYNEFMNSLENTGFKKFAAHATKQKNMDRNLEYVLQNLSIKKEFEASCLNLVFFGGSLKNAKIQSPTKNTKNRIP